MAEIIFLVNRELWPLPLGGGQLRWLRTLEHLARSNDVHLVGRVNPGRVLPHEKEWLAPDITLASVTFVEAPCNDRNHWLLTGYPWGTPLRRILAPLRGGVPSLFAAFMSPPFIAKLRQIRKQRGNLRVWASDLTLGESAALAGFTNVAVDLDDVESCIWLTELRSRRASLSRTLHKMDASRANRFERSAAMRFACVSVAKEDDIALFDSRSHHRIHVVPNGNDDAPPGYQRSPDDEAFLFVGSLGWTPNVLAIQSLLHAIFPRIRERLPNAKLIIAGRGPVPPKFQGKLPDGVTIVESPIDLSGLYSRATMMLQPVRTGGGTRLKSIDAMAHSVPIVATKFCVAGLGAVPGQHYAQAESDEEFAEVAVALRNDPARARAVGEAGRALYMPSFTWKAALRSMDHMIETAMNSDTGGQ